MHTMHSDRSSVRTTSFSHAVAALYIIHVFALLLASARVCSLVDLYILLLYCCLLPAAACAGGG